MTVFVDPPSGWMYGFPRTYDKETQGTLKDFLVKNGYPEKDVDFALKYMRFIDPREELEKEVDDGS